MTTLTTGVYELPPDCKAMVRDGKVIVTPKRKPLTAHHDAENASTLHRAFQSTISVIPLLSV